MDRPGAPSLASTPDNANVNATGNQGSPRARKKLQKTVGLPSSHHHHGRRPTSASVSVSVSRATATATATKNGNGKKAKPRVKSSSRQTSSNPRQPSARTPDLSDSKWLEYVRSHHSKESLKLPTSMVRDLSYLTVNKPPHHQSHGSRFKMSTTRRRAKTPVFSIGQLEGLSLKRYASPTRAAPAESDLTAEQYKRLVDDCDTNSLYSDAHSEPPPSRLGYREEEYEPRRQRSSDDLPSNGLFPSLTADSEKPLAMSPTSDDGTLVSFEEETVYFKPVSFSPEPWSPAHNHSSSFESNASNPFASPNNLSLQICLDLLTRELTSAISDPDRRQRPGNEISALQIWVMIEAFERLRDQVAEMRLGVGGVSGVENMFETWIKALYSIHDSLTAESHWREAEESEYETLQEALD